MSNKRIVAALQELEDRHGRLTAARVLEAAREPTHPLHSCFEWDDNVAAERYRVEQARELIRGVRVNIMVEKVKTPVIAYVRDPSADKALVQGYRSTKKLSRDEDEARQAVDAEFDQAAAHLRRARDIAAALGFREEIERRLHDLVDLQAKIRKSTKPAAEARVA